MYKVILSQQFKRSYKRFVIRFPYLKNNIDFAIRELEQNPFVSSISSHKLSGNLYELYACKCGYDCRILFSFEKNEAKEDIIVLVEIGTHNEVY